MVGLKAVGFLAAGVRVARLTVALVLRKSGSLKPASNSPCSQTIPPSSNLPCASLNRRNEESTVGYRSLTYVDMSTPGQLTLMIVMFRKGIASATRRPKLTSGPKVPPWLPLAISPNVEDPGLMRGSSWMREAIFAVRPTRGSFCGAEFDM